MLAMTSAIYLAAPPASCPTRGRSDACHPPHPSTPAAPKALAEPARLTNGRPLG